MKRSAVCVLVLLALSGTASAAPDVSLVTATRYSSGDTEIYIEISESVSNDRASEGFARVRVGDDECLDEGPVVIASDGPGFVYVLSHLCDLVVTGEPYPIFVGPDPVADVDATQIRGTSVDIADHDQDQRPDPALSSPTRAHGSISGAGFASLPGDQLRYLTGNA